MGATVRVHTCAHSACSRLALVPPGMLATHPNLVLLLLLLLLHPATATLLLLLLLCQALMAAVGLQRREAEDALKQTGGDVAVALAHQLGRLRLQTPLLDCLVWEYATARWVALAASQP